MRLDGEVWRRKFDDQVRRVRERESLLRSWGCYIVSCDAPELRALWLPPPGVTVQMPLIARLDSNGIELLGFHLPQLAGRSFGVRIGLDDYDQRPPSVTIVDPYNWEPLEHGEFHGAVNLTGAGLQNLWVSPHPRTGRPFLCIRGFREYHEHPEHDGDPWILQRRDVDALHVLNVIHRTCILNIRPQVALVMNVLMKVQAAPVPPELPTAPVTPHQEEEEEEGEEEEEEEGPTQGGTTSDEED